MNNYWKFTEIAIIEDLMFNPSLEKFYRFKIDGMVRENIQNSLDAVNKNLDKPVIITINLGEINSNELPGIDEIKKRIPCLKGASEYTNETIENMKNALRNEKIKYITFEDENTKGLKYLKNNEEKDTLRTCAYKKGVHNIDDDAETEKNRGGSHGVGKIASNAASEVYLMYFCNCDDEGKKHIGGNIQLIEHGYKDKYYRSTGYFTENLVNEIPFTNNYSGIFSKNNTGLKVIIPYYKEEFGQEKEIIKSICENFFIAILNDELIVKVNNIIIDKENIKSFIEDEEYFPIIQGKRNIEMTPLYYKTYTEIEKQEIIIQDKNKKNYGFNLYFRYDESIPKGRVAIIRSIGMKIENFKIENCATKPFNAVLIPKNSDCDMFLKSLENESHTELSYKHFKKKDLENNAKKFISNLDKELRKILNEHIKNNNKPDGKIETDELLYIIENSFEKISNEKIAVYNTGINEIIKTKPETRKKRNEKSLIRVTPTKSSKNRKPKEYNENKERLKEEVYQVTSHFVKRALVNQKEILEIDLSTCEEIKNKEVVDLKIKLIDGMGLEYEDEFNAENDYTSVLDKGNNEKKRIEKNKIKNIIIKNKKIQLELSLNKIFNKSLKFRYYLEV